MFTTFLASKHYDYAFFLNLLNYKIKNILNSVCNFKSFWLTFLSISFGNYWTDLSGLCNGYTSKLRYLFDKIVTMNKAFWKIICIKPKKKFLRAKPFYWYSHTFKLTTWRKWSHLKLKKFGQFRYKKKILSNESNTVITWSSPIKLS